MDPPTGVTFTEQLVLNVGTAVVGTLVLGALVSWIARQAQDRREKHALRERLIRGATEASTGLYLATQQYWRARVKDAVDDETLRSQRAEVDMQYQRSRKEGEVLEQLLMLHFPKDTRPRQLCHRVMDLLTVRYFQVVSPDRKASLQLRQANEGPDHSGLSAADLDAPARLLASYHEAQAVLIDAIVDGEISVTGALRQRPRAAPHPEADEVDRVI